MDAGPAFTGTAGNDVFNANPGAANANTFTALDSLDGGAGIDTLNVTEIGIATASPYVLNTAATVKNIEVLNYTVASDHIGDEVTADVSNWTGLTTANIVISGVDAPVAALTTKGNVTAVTINGATTAGITDSAAAGSDKLASVTLVDTTGLATIASDAVTSLNLNGASGGATVTAAAGARALSLNLNNVTAGTVTDAEATSLSIAAKGAKTTGGTVTAAKATTVSIAADEALTLGALNVAAATALTVTGDSLVTLTAGTYTALKTVDATGSTGGLALGGTIGNDVVFTGGAGKDTVSVAETTKVIDMGAGDDTVIFTAAALGVAGAVKGGDGTDTVSIGAALAATASADAKFAAAVTGFEKLALTTATNQTVDVKALGNYKLVSTAGGNGLTLSNLASGATLELTGAGTAYTVGNTDFTAGTADVLNLALKNGTGATVAFASTGITAANVETIAITTADTQTTPTGAFLDSLTLLGNSATTITVAGNAGLALTAASTALTSFDASGSTAASTAAGADAKGVTWTTGVLANAATITGSNGVDIIDATAATKAVTLNGGLGGKVGSLGDTLTGGAGDDTITSSGLGNHVLSGGAGKDTITGASGNDTITGGAGADTLKGNGGNDIFKFNLAADSAPTAFDTITDFVAKTATVAGDVLSFSTAAFGGTGAAVATFGAVFVANSGSLALAALSANTDHDIGKVFFALDSSTGTLYVDGAGAGAGITTASDGTADMAIVLAGVTTIDTNAIAFAA